MPASAVWKLSELNTCGWSIVTETCSEEEEIINESCINCDGLCVILTLLYKMDAILKTKKA
jgi:hypothetical protein